MTSLTARAEAILAQAKKLDAFLEGHGLPYPSFNVDPLDGLPAEMQDLRSSLANASNDLRKLMRGAVMQTIDVAMSVSLCCNAFRTQSNDSFTSHSGRTQCLCKSYTITISVAQCHSRATPHMQKLQNFQGLTRVSVDVLSVQA